MQYCQSYDFLSNNYIFDSKNIENLNFADLKKAYTTYVKSNLTKKDHEVVLNINRKIRLFNHKDIFTITPIYLGEDDNQIQETINEIKKQNWDFLSILYINWYEPIHDIHFMNKKIKNINKCIWKDKRFFVISNLYKNKREIWHIIADIYDWFLMSVDRDAIIVRIDADLKELPKNYFLDLKNHFKNRNISYINSKTYYTKPTDNFVWIWELISDLWWYWNSKDITKVPTYGPGMTVRAADWLKIKWTQRDMERMEDYVIARKITQYYWSLETPDYSRGKRHDDVVYYSPRRQVQNMLEWRYFHENTYEFNFVDEKKLDKRGLDYYNNIVHKMINKMYVPLAELNIIEDYINWFSMSRKNISKDFQEYWNKEVLKNSLYMVNIKNEYIYFTEKNFIDLL